MAASELKFFITQVTCKKYMQGLYDQIDQIQTRIYNTILRFKTGNFIMLLMCRIYICFLRKLFLLEVFLHRS
jgi:hypothetical protein